MLSLRAKKGELLQSSSASHASGCVEERHIVSTRQPRIHIRATATFVGATSPPSDDDRTRSIGQLGCSTPQRSNLAVSKICEENGTSDVGDTSARSVRPLTGRAEFDMVAEGWKGGGFGTHARASSNSLYSFHERVILARATLDSARSIYAKDDSICDGQVVIDLCPESRVPWEIY